MKKRILSILLAMVMVVSMGTGALAADASGLRLSISYGEEEIRVDAYLTAKELTNGRIELAFDASNVKLVSIKVGNTNWITSVNRDTKGKLSFAWVGSSLSESETLMFTAVFTEVKDGSGAGVEYTAKVKEAYNNGKVVTLTNDSAKVVGQSVTVQEPIFTPPANIGGSTGSTGSTGTTTETVTNPDGSTTTTKVDASGNVTEIVKATDGTVTETVKATDGTVTETIKTTDGTAATTVKDADGKVTAMSAEVPATAEGETVTLPLTVTKATDTSSAVPISVEIPKNVKNVEVEIPVEDVTPGSVVVLVYPDGTEEIVPKTKLTDDGLQITVDGSVTVKVVDNSKDFKDSNTWASNAIDFVTSRELFNGTSEDTFAPEENMSRAMLATVLWRMEGKESGDGMNFEDVDDGKWYSDAISWASETGIINGYGDSFGTNDSLTREQMITILYRLVGEPDVDTSVSGTSAWSADAMAWAVETGLIQGNGNGLNAKGTATRAEVATILMRFMNL